MDARGSPLTWRAALSHAFALALAFGLVVTLALLLRPLLLLLAGAVIALALATVVDWLERWLPRTAAVVLVYLTLLAAVGLVGWIVLPPLVSQAQSLAAAAPDLVVRGQEWLDRWDPLPVNQDQVVGAAQRLLGRIAGLLVSLPARVLSVTLDITLVLAMSAYLLLAGPALHRFMLSLVAPRHRQTADSVLREMGRTMGGYVRGTLLDGLIVAVLVYVGLALIGVQFPLVLALIAFTGELVPVLGPIVAGAPAVAIALLDGWQRALIALVFYVVMQQFESYVLLPNIMRRQADIPPLLTLFALVAGAALAGFLGALLALPLSGAIRIFVLRVVAPAVRRWSGAESVETAADPPT